VAAKTGTTQEFRDAWTVGFTPNIAVGVWAGNNDSRPMRAGADGSFVAAPIWNKFMSQVLPSYPNETFLAYEKNNNQPLPEITAKPEYKITYYRKSSNKKISEEKAKSLKADKVTTRIEMVSSNTDGSEITTDNAKIPVF
jgi:penicillin-binding protein 1A